MRHITKTDNMVVKATHTGMIAFRSDWGGLKTAPIITITIKEFCIPKTQINFIDSQDS